MRDDFVDEHLCQNRLTGTKRGIDVGMGRAGGNDHDDFAARVAGHGVPSEPSAKGVSVVGFEPVVQFLRVGCDSVGVQGHGETCHGATDSAHRFAAPADLLLPPTWIVLEKVRRFYRGKAGHHLAAARRNWGRVMPA
jgi:hypothetical protein